MWNYMFVCGLHNECFFFFFFPPDHVQAQVLYDFIAEPGNNELSVKEGETVTITNQVNLYQNSSSSAFLLLELHLRNIIIIY